MTHLLLLLAIVKVLLSLTLTCVVCQTGAAPVQSNILAHGALMIIVVFSRRCMILSLISWNVV